MRSGGNSFNYFPENQRTKLAHLVHFNVWSGELGTATRELICCGCCYNRLLLR